MRIEYRRPICRKTGLAKDAEALRVLARAADMSGREAVRVAVAGDPPPGRSALDCDAQSAKKPWLDPAKISAAGNLVQEWGTRRERWVKVSGGDE